MLSDIGISAILANGPFRLANDYRWRVGLSPGPNGRFANCAIPLARKPMCVPMTGPTLRAVEYHRAAAAGEGPAVVDGIRYPGVGWMLLVWTVMAALAVARYQLPFGSAAQARESLSYFVGCASWYLPWGVLTPLVFRLERTFPVGGSGWPRRLALLAAVSLPFCLASSVLMMACFGVVRYIAGAPSGTRAGGFFWIAAFPSAEGLFWVSAAGGYFLRTLFLLHQQQQRAAQLAIEKSRLEASLNQAQLETLRARLNPHFLFNSLQNISVLTKQDPQTASRMLAELGDLLRAVLRRDTQPECTLGEEMELARSYIALEQMRFAEKLQVTFDIPDRLSQAMVPSFLMQPLLENAIKHGLRGVRKTGIIEVRAAEEDHRLAIAVADNGVGPPADASKMKVGIGLGSIGERLARMYGEQHQFSIRPVSEGGTEVRLVIPLRFGSSVADPVLHEEIPAFDR